MRLPIPALLASWQLIHPDTGHQRRDYHKFSPRAVITINVGPGGATCPAIPTTTIELQPVFYSEYMPFNTIIDPFRNQNPLIVTNAPTTVVTAGYLTRTITGSNPTNPSNPDNGSKPGGGSTPDNGSNPTNPPNSDNPTNPSSSNNNAPTGPSSGNAGASTTAPTQSGANASPTFTPGPGNNGIPNERIPPVDSQISNVPPPSGPNSVVGDNTIISTPSAGSNGTTMSNTAAGNATATGSGSMSSGMIPSGSSNGNGAGTDSMNMGSTFTASGMTMSANSANTIPDNPASSSSNTLLPSGSNPSASPGTTPLSVAPLALGQGVPAGSLTDLPANQFLFLAFTRNAANPGVKRDVNIHRRQQQGSGPTATGSASVSEASVVDLSPPSATPSSGGSLTPDQCDSATPFNLVNGTLSGGNFTLSKEFGTTETLFGTVTDPDAATVNVTFSLIDGVLSWVTPDRGVGQFHYCFGSTVYVSFPGDQDPSSFEVCEAITVGAIAGDLCRAFVAQTRTPRADFVAPLATASSSSSTAGKSSGTLPSNLPGTSSGTLPQTPQGSLPGTLPPGSLPTLPGTPSVPLSPPTGSPSAVPLTQLPAACLALNSLTGTSIASQLAQCRISLGVLPSTNARVATCLATGITLSTRGTDITLCLNLALGLSTGGTPSLSLPTGPQLTTPSVSLTLPNPSISISVSIALPSPGLELTDACRALNGLTGLALQTQLTLCTASLGSLVDTNLNLASCLANPAASGTDIVQCLLNALSGVPGSPSSTGTGRIEPPFTPTSPGSGPLPTDLDVLTPECRALTGLTTTVISQLTLCSASLGDLALDPNVANCLVVPVIENANGTAIVVCLTDALLRLEQASSTLPGITTPTGTGVIGIPTPTVSLPAACSALNGLTGPNVAGQLDLCRTSLGDLADQANVLTCLNVAVGANTLGSNIVVCLDAALGITGPGTTTIPPIGTPLSSLLPSVSPISLTAACQALQGLTGFAVTQQLALCTTSLGNLATQADVASCVGVTVGVSTLGSNIVACLDAALGISLPGSTTTRSLSSLLPSASPGAIILTPDCQALQSLTGFAVEPQLALCTTSLGSLAALPGVAACLAVNVGLNTNGASIVTCLDNAFSTPASAATFSTPLTPVTPRSGVTLPTGLPNALTPACQALVGINGLAIATQLALCADSLGSLALRTAVASCLNTDVNALTVGANVALCITAALDEEEINTLSSSLTSIPLPTATPLSALTPACQELAGLTGTDVISQATLCTASLGNLASLPEVSVCLQAINVNTLGDNLVRCLDRALGISTTSVSIPSQTSITLPTNIPRVLTSACAAIENLSGLQITPQLQLCATSLGNLALDPDVAGCLATTVDPGTQGSGIVDCLIDALDVLSLPSTSLRSTTSRTNIVLPTPSLPVLSAECDALANVNGQAVSAQLSQCTASLGSLALRPDIASCLSVTITGSTIGGDILDCLIDALDTPSPSSSLTPILTLPSTNLPIPTPSLPVVLSAECDALANVNGQQVSNQLALCTQSLGNLASLPAVASCLSVTVDATTIGGDILDCLTDALDASPPSSSFSLSLPPVSIPSLSLPPVSLPSLSLPSVSLPSVPLPSVSLPPLSLPSISIPSLSLPPILTLTSASLSLPTPTLPALTAACDALENTNGIQVSAQLALCATSLGSLTLQADVASCLSVTVDASTIGSDILDCLVDAVLSPNTTPSGSAASTPTRSISLPPLPSCLENLPLACNALNNLVGLGVSVQLDLCSAVLESVASTNAVANACLDTDVQANTRGSDITACLNAALLCPGQSTSSRSALSTTSTSTSTTASPICLNVLPDSCENLAGESGLSLLAGLGDCQLDLPLNIQSSATVCLNVDISSLVNGQSVVDCLHATVLCPGVTASTTRRTAASTTATATGTPTPVCLTALPATCNALSGYTGFGLTLPVLDCYSNIAPLVAGQTLADVTTCLSTAAILIDTPGSSIVACLTAAALCPASTASTSALSITTNTIAPSITASPSPSIALPPLPICVNTLPNVCSSITGTGLTALLAPVQACGLELLPQLSLAGQAAAGSCLATNAILPTTTGADIRACLNAAVVCSSTTRSTTTQSATATTLRSVSTTSPSPGPSATAAPLQNCITALPAACQVLNQTNGTALLGPLGLCQASLLPELTLAGTSKALLCLATVTLSDLPPTQGSQRLQCLNNNVICGGSNALLP